MEQLKSALSQNGNIWILSLTGSVGPNTHNLIWPTENSASLLQNMMDAGATKLIVDLTNTKRFDSHGLRLLLNAQKEFLTENISIILRNPNSHLNRLFQIMQFDRVFEIEFVD